ncbi:MAG: PPC domain-containing protein [Gemmataceae bacterium]
MILRTLCLLALLAPPLLAAPTVTALLPAGGQRGKTVEITASGTFPRWPVDVWVEGTGVSAQAGKEKGKLTLTIAADAVPGPRWLRLVDSEGASSPRRIVIGTLPELLEQEPNDDRTQPQILPGPATVVHGKLARSGDVDCFAVKGRKGQTLVASMDAQRWLGSPMDGVLQIVSETGFVLAQNNDHHGQDPQVVLPLEADGTYIVRVFGFPAVADATIGFAGGERFQYRLTITTGPFIDHAWPVAVERSKLTPVELVGWNLPGAVGRQAVVPFGDEGRVFLPEAGGLGLVALEAHGCAIRSGETLVAVPSTTTARLAGPNESHPYRFQGKKGQRYLFQVESPSRGFVVDPTLRLTDAAGKLLGQARAGELYRDVELLATIPADGAYLLTVGDETRHGGPRHVYLLRARLVEPDFALQVKADQFSVAPGKTLDVPITVERKHGFAGPIDLTIEGLPQGVRAQAVPGMGATQTLRLTADEKAKGGGPIRIVGKAGARSVLARATLTDPEATTSELWLTLSGAPLPAPPTKKKKR